MASTVTGGFALTFLSPPGQPWPCPPAVLGSISARSGRLDLSARQLHHTFFHSSPPSFLDCIFEFRYYYAAGQTQDPVENLRIKVNLRKVTASSSDADDSHAAGSYDTFTQAVGWQQKLFSRAETEKSVIQKFF